MHGADDARLRQRVHALVEAIDQPIDGGAAADAVEHGRGDVAVSHHSSREAPLTGPAGEANGDQRGVSESGEAVPLPGCRCGEGISGDTVGGAGLGAG